MDASHLAEAKNPAGSGLAAASALIGALVVALAAISPAAAADAPRVVASIKPVNSLVAAVMAGVGEPHLIVRGAGSPHTSALRPSDAAALSEADAIFWIGPQVENFLIKPIGALGTDAATVTLWDAPGVSKLKARSGAMFEPDDDAPSAAEPAADAGAEGDNPYNEHVWLDPENAVAMTKAIAATLERVDPGHADTYRKNAEAYVQRLHAVETEVAAVLKGVPQKPYVVFHDAYQYFEHRFHVPAAGAITVSPEKAPGAARLREIRTKVESVDAACVFTEPEFEPSLVATIVEGTNARTGVLDPLGADLADGPDLYPTLMRNLARDLAACLGKG
ncbi:zinc ABC transporter substrate-binding protein [Jiella sonneratiae]|uniref:zinc ABC transporter substrate-binding protein n=1 Tax=Jiella sonneratiae TaxID=2816856 RepID=UPI00315A8E8C